MESSNSEWIGDLSSEYSFEPLHTPITNIASNINCADSDSPQLSGDSQECFSELTLKSKKSEKNVVKFNLMNTSLAKKRLQAYSQQIHKIPIKEDKSECKEQRQDISFKKKKDMYHIEKAKSVIQEIEEEKRKEIAEGKRKEIEDNNLRHLLATTVKYLHDSIDHHPSRESAEQFRRREIKQRNYRRTDSTSRKSASPEVHHHRSKTRSSPVHKYPKNWSEYNANKYDKPSYKNHSKNRSVKDMLDNLYNFHLPSPYIELFRCNTENGTQEISPFFLRRTKSKPSIIYSVNFEKIKESFLTRDQLFEMVSEERRQAIKSLISSHSKLQPLNKMVESKSWYNKTWRKHTDAECKILENSVGLSFLQTYSDEEEENETEEILICSSINNSNNSKIKKVPNDSLKPIDKSFDEFIVINECQEEDLQSGNKIFEEINKSPTLNVSTIPDDETGILTPEIPLQLQKSFKRTESNNIELGSQKEIEEHINENKSKNKVKKNKASKRKMESTPKKKKKKKKRKRQTSDEQSNSSEEEKKKKVKRKKSKDKKGKTSKNKKETKKSSSSKDLKSKKKAKLSEQLDLNDKNAKKKKTETEKVEIKSPLLDDLRKKLKKKLKNRKDLKNSILDKVELRGENQKYSGKHDEQKTVDLIAINKSYRRNLELDVQEKLNLSNSETDRSKTPKNPKKREINDDFTLQKDIFVDCLEGQTPDTDEYKGNWEKDSFGSVEENLLLQTKLNSSWESDDDLYEKQERPNEHIRNYSEVSNFEIPLNIKPFKKRDLDTLKTKIEGTKLYDEKIIPISLPVKETSRRLDKFKIDVEEIKKPSRRLGEFKIDAEELRKPTRRIDELKIDAEEIKKPPRRIDEFKIDTAENKKTSKKVDEIKIDAEESKKPSRRLDEFKIDTAENKKISKKIDEFKIDTEEIKKPARSIDEFKIDTAENKKPSKKINEFKIDTEETKKSRRMEEFKIHSEKIKEATKRIDEFKIDTEETKKTLKRIDAFKIATGETKRMSRNIDEFKIHTEYIKEASRSIDEFKIDIGETRRTQRIFDEFDIDTDEIFSMHSSVPEISNKNKDTINMEEQKQENIVPVISEKKRRWDKTERESTPISSFKTNNVSVPSLNSSSLENEYVEFMKAVTSNTDSLSSSKIDDSIISVSSNESVEIIGTISSEKIQNNMSLETQRKPDCVISPKDIPFIPMPDEFKPVPVPSPLLENISKPLISFSLPTSIIKGLDSPIGAHFKKSLESPVFPENNCSYVDSSTQAFIDDVSSSNFLLEAVPKKEDDVSKDIKNVSSPKKPITFTTLVLPSKETVSKEEEVFKDIKNISSPKKPFTFSTLVSPTKAAVYKEEELISSEIKKVSSPKIPFTFTTLVLPTKKTLLNNSNLKLCDSDDEIDNTMKPIDEIRREQLTESDVEGIIQTEHILNMDMPIKIQKPEKPVVQQEQIQQKSLSSPPKTVQTDNVKSGKRDLSPKRIRKRESSPRHKSYSPKKDSSPKRRRRSPERYRDRERDRRRKSSGAGGRRYSSRRTRSPSRSPRRRSPKRSPSPRGRSSIKSTSKITDRFISNSKKPKHEPSTAEIQHQKSPSIASPLEGLKRSVADSTISDDSLLPQPNLEEYTQSPLPQFFNLNKSEEKRISLDDRINMELGWQKEELQPISTTYESYHYNQNQFLQASQIFSPNTDQNRNMYSNANASSNFVQVGNMVQIVPKDLTEMDNQSEFGQHEKKSQILQVGNMIQIVPNEMPPEIPLPPSPITSPKETPSAESTVTDNVSSDLDHTHNECERKAERDKRKKDREARRKEKENRRREKEKQRNVKMKEKTENMIMRALQLEVENNEEVESDFNESASHWPPSLNASGSKDVLNKSILVQGRRRSSKGKNVQFADGIRPGDGTSPSAGEDLCASPPSKVLPKEKRYTRTKLRGRNMKKKVKVKIIKHNPDQTQSEVEENGDGEDDHLPPPSPPPGSPPPHIFPPRIKTIINNMQAYIPNVLGNQNQPVYTPTMNPLMATQTLSRLQQYNIAGGQPHAPPLPESHIPVHHLAHYPLSSVGAPPPPPVVTSDSSYGTTQRLYKYTTH